jgi:hypothetical protein
VVSLFLLNLIDFKTYTSYKALPETWNSLVAHDIFLQRDYLKVLEASSPNNISVYYIGVFNNEDLVGMAIIQRVQLYAADVFRNKTNTAIKRMLKQLISKILKGNILVVGNLMQTGQHGVFLNESKVSYPEFLQALVNAIESLQENILKEEKKKIRLILFKDYFNEDAIHLNSDLLLSKKFYKVKAQPNMIMDIKSNWLVLNDYTANMTTKYRTRFKRAKKKLNSIKCQELDADAIKKNTTQLYKLYLNVSENAKINTFILSEHHFSSLKEALQNNFKIFGYYQGEELIGFYSLILNNKSLETYFLGYDEAHQYQNQLYLNMLYDMAKFAIEHKFKSVIYARTAMEIKSSVGAKPKEMFMYIKHTNAFLNTLLNAIFNIMNPKQKWEERHPFKN